LIQASDRGGNVGSGGFLDCATEPSILMPEIEDFSAVLSENRSLLGGKDIEILARFLPSVADDPTEGVGQRVRKGGIGSAAAHGGGCH
jgi:hypothetical protein